MRGRFACECTNKLGQAGEPVVTSKGKRMQVNQNIGLWKKEALARVNYSVRTFFFLSLSFFSRSSAVTAAEREEKTS